MTHMHITDDPNSLGLTAESAPDAPPATQNQAMCCCATQMVIDGQLYAVKSRNAGCRVHGLDLADKWIPQTHLLTTHESAHATSTKRSSKQKVR